MYTIEAIPESRSIRTIGRTQYRDDAEALAIAYLEHYPTAIEVLVWEGAPEQNHLTLLVGHGYIEDIA